MTETKSLKSLSAYYNKFSHIYVEKEIANHKNTENILNKLKNSKVIIIDNYKDVFNRKRQNFYIQKKSQNLILAKKHYDFYYKGSENCEDFNNSNFYYTSFILNCPYYCQYCYLQGMYNSANVVVFVNIEDYFKSISNLCKNKYIYLCLSYDSDILAMEGITGFTGLFIEFIKEHKNILAEIRTKSASFSAIKHKYIPNNIIFAWSLLPQEVINMYEYNTPSLGERINSIKTALEKDLEIRISIEPVMKIKNFDKVYTDFIDYLFKEISAENVRDINIGVFRLSKVHYKRMKNNCKNVFAYDFTNNDNTVTYNDYEELRKIIYNKVSKYIDKNKIY